MFTNGSRGRWLWSGFPAGKTDDQARTLFISPFYARKAGKWTRRRPNRMSSDPPALLTDLLRQVSRSFYLTLKVLPRAVRGQIGLAYLLARTTDTIADTEVLPAAERLAALEALREAIAGRAAAPSFGQLAEQQADPAEAMLLQRVGEALSLLDSFPDDRELIRNVLAVIISGQELDLKRFSGSAQGEVVSLETPAELDDYTYRVAGVVGDFWTRICRKHLFPKAKIDEAALFDEGVKFGKGLQLVNILRDLPKDLALGRCYIPSETLREVNLRPADLLDPAVEPRFRPVYDPLLARAEDFLQAGWDYTNRLPWACARVRLACAWPVLLGVGTLRQLQVEVVLDPAHRVKVTRSEVRSILVKSTLLYPLPFLWRDLYSARPKK